VTDRHICAQLWTGPQINYDGEMLGCCTVKKSWGAGNVLVSGLGPVFNGDKMRRARLMVLGRGEEYEDIACASCMRYKRMKQSGKWLTLREVNFLRLLARIRRSLVFRPMYYAAMHRAALRLAG
jgi:hypothetical protein